MYIMLYTHVRKFIQILFYYRLDIWEQEPLYALLDGVGIMNQGNLNWGTSSFLF